ncbi:MAG: hypothetical protein ACRERE_06120 [Candidatus Entotheonellia bacterium]
MDTPTLQRSNRRVKRKRDLVTLADFGARTGRRWLVRDVLLALRREGLMSPELAHIVPTALMNDPASYIAEALRSDEIWMVAEAYDALRLESYGFPALATEDKTSLTLDDLSSCQWIILLQRPGEEETLAGLDVRGELLKVGWSGTLSSLVLPFVDLDVAEGDCGSEGFGPFLVSLLTHGTIQHLAGEQNVVSKGGFRETVSAKSGRWPSRITVEVR